MLVAISVVNIALKVPTKNSTAGSNISFPPVTHQFETNLLKCTPSLVTWRKLLRARNSFGKLFAALKFFLREASLEKFLLLTLVSEIRSVGVFASVCESVQLTHFLRLQRNVKKMNAFY